MSKKNMLIMLSLSMVVSFVVASISQWFAWYTSLTFGQNVAVTTAISTLVITLVAAFYVADSGVESDSSSDVDYFVDEDNLI